MANEILLAAAARAYALVSFADGRLDRAETERFGAFVAEEPLLAGTGDADRALEAALAIVRDGASFAAALPQIVGAADTAAEKALIIRAGRLALVADQANAPQENAALAALARGLGLDPAAA